MNRNQCVATESDAHRACVIVDAWRQSFESAKNLHPEAAQALRGVLAQALADERRTELAAAREEAALRFRHMAIVPFRPVCGADEQNQATTGKPENVTCLACMRECVRVVTNERDEVAALLRRAIGVISDAERTRPEAAAVLDRYAELWPVGGRL